MHGGRNAGAPKGNRNAQTHGLWWRTENLKWEISLLDAEVSAEIAGTTFDLSTFPPRKKRSRKNQDSLVLETNTSRDEGAWAEWQRWLERNDGFAPIDTSKLDLEPRIAPDSAHFFPEEMTPLFATEAPVVGDDRSDFRNLDLDPLSVEAPTDHTHAEPVEETLDLRKLESGQLSHAEIDALIEHIDKMEPDKAGHAVSMIARLLIAKDAGAGVDDRPASSGPDDVPGRL